MGYCKIGYSPVGEIGTPLTYASSRTKMGLIGGAVAKFYNKL